MKSKFQCPICHFYTLSEKHGNEICAVCFWEDDLFESDGLDCPSGANYGLTIREGQINYKEFGACDPLMIPHVREPFDRECPQ